MFVIYEALKQDITEELEKLESGDSGAYKQLKESWTSTTTDIKKESVRLLIPFIGSGLNAMIKGGPNSWIQLVKTVRETTKSPWTEHEVDTADLSKPQELESYFAKYRNDCGTKEKIFKAFKFAFDNKYSPNSFHKRLVELFPYIVTTNYDNILSSVNKAPKSFDLTDPETQPGDPFKYPRAIIHLHGKWDTTLSSEEQKNQIFWGVGSGSILEKKCLILTENQYHRLYSQSTRFQQAINRLFSNEHLLLFLGSGLSSDEFGIHHILRGLQTIGRNDPVGIYIGFNLNPMKIEMLRGRGILSLSLPGKFGYKYDITEIVFNTLFDAFEEIFEKKSVNDKQKRVIKLPDILCCGLSSRQKVFALDVEPRKETSNWIRADKFCEEAGGQHLLPALNLARLEYKVAFCTRLGDDDDGDWVLKQMGQFVQNTKGNGDIDTQLVLRKGHTRSTYVITYPDNKDKVEDIQPGTREIFDYEATEKGSHSDWLEKEEESEFRKKIRRFKNVKALYLGPYGLDIQKMILKEINNAKYRFLETGTSGGPRLQELLSIAKNFTHIIASAEFIYRVQEKNIENGRKLDFQKHLYNEICNKQTSLIHDTYTDIWGKTGKGTLVVTLGCYGAVYLEKFDKKFELVKISKTDKKPQICWIGCGDMFRSEFIHAVLKKKTIKEACQDGNKASYEKTKRMTFLP